MASFSPPMLVYYSSGRWEQMLVKLKSKHICSFENWMWNVVRKMSSMLSFPPFGECTNIKFTAGGALVKIILNPLPLFYLKRGLPKPCRSDVCSLRALCTRKWLTAFSSCILLKENCCSFINTALNFIVIWQMKTGYFAAVFQCKYQSFVTFLSK